MRPTVLERMMMAGVRRKEGRGMMEGGNQFGGPRGSDDVLNAGREGRWLQETGKTGTSGLGHWVVPSGVGPEEASERESEQGQGERGSPRCGHRQAKCPQHAGTAENTR